MEKGNVVSYKEKGRAVTMIILLIAMSCLILIRYSLKKEVDKEMEMLRNSLGTGFILKQIRII